MTAVTTNGGIRNKLAIAYLEKHAYPDIKMALQEFIAIIHENGELEKHWATVEKKSYQARRAANRLEKLQKKLEMGSDYEDSGNEREQD
mmetsp:Transcript_11790/g.11725  ORF Transcript_11790/g.11725 Transcript_11790/m.11725 type:complete len:89 (-) Transcript_11790:259-525(-)|eukprot:CAMPEP_0170556536 /NCGR_PEP_ID=MMETSP0211-20121228/17315_1 /TAXON_ID=311385 /ORGANISM="Pseudokeronopsis sp., Strain OXSARD2" /LENGTH=88 /DNA_ID=CAMNT_0010866935 /DNA_START=55 /DNA_END=321 /DNA_ORIENTATION=+